MAERRRRSSREDVIFAKLFANVDKRVKYQEKIRALDAANAELKQQLKELEDAQKKAKRAAKAKEKK